MADLQEDEVAAGFSDLLPEETVNAHQLALVPQHFQQEVGGRDGLRCTETSRGTDVHTGALDTLRGFVDAMWKDQEMFQQSINNKDKAVMKLEAKLHENDVNLRSAQESECRLLSKVRQGEEEIRHLGRKITLLSEQQNRLLMQLNNCVHDATKAEQERVAIGSELAKSNRTRQVLEKKLETSEEAASVANTAVIETRKTLEEAKIQLAAQTEKNAQLQSRNQILKKELAEHQKECNHLRQMHQIASESKARLSADAKHQISLLKGQVTAAKHEVKAAEESVQKAQQLADQYLNELQDSEAVLAAEQRKAALADEQYQSSLVEAQQTYRKRLAHLENQVEASASKLIQTMSDQKVQVRELEMKITHLENQLVQSGEDSGKKFNRLVKETGEQFDKMREEQAKEVTALHKQAAEQAEIIVQQSAEIERLESEKMILTATLEQEAQAAQIAVSTLDSIKQKVEDDVRDMRIHQETLLETNATLHESCQSLTEKLQNAISTVEKLESEKLSVIEREKCLQHELDSLKFQLASSYRLGKPSQKYESESNVEIADPGLQKDNDKGRLEGEREHHLEVGAATNASSDECGKDGNGACRNLKGAPQKKVTKTTKPPKRVMRGSSLYETSQCQPTPFLRPRQRKEGPDPHSPKKTAQAKSQDLSMSYHQTIIARDSQELTADRCTEPDAINCAPRGSARRPASKVPVAKRRKRDNRSKTCGIRKGQMSRKRVEASPPLVYVPSHEHGLEQADVLEYEDPVASIFGDFSRNQLLNFP